MGMDRSVGFAGEVPPWPDVLALLSQRGLPIKVQMIDGELAFPDELPGANWRELRLGVPGGTVTVRRQPHRVTCVVWGNAASDLSQSWQAVAQAFADAGSGTLEPGPA